MRFSIVFYENRCDNQYMVNFIVYFECGRSELDRAIVKAKDQESAEKNAKKLLARLYAQGHFTRVPLSAITIDVRPARMGLL